MFIELVVFLNSEDFWGLRFIFFWCLVRRFLGGSQAHKNVGLLGSCFFWVLMVIYLLFVLQKTFGVLCSKAQEPLLLMQPGKSSKIRNKNTRTLERK